MYYLSKSQRRRGAVLTERDRLKRREMKGERYREWVLHALEQGLGLISLRRGREHSGDDQFSRFVTKKKKTNVKESFPGQGITLTYCPPRRGGILHCTGGRGGGTGGLVVKCLHYFGCKKKERITRWYIPTMTSRMDSSPGGVLRGRGRGGEGKHLVHQAQGGHGCGGTGSTYLPSLNPPKV